jgi:hypothetical protein
MEVAVARKCTQWHSFRKSGTRMRSVEPFGTGVGTKVGIKALLIQRS